MWGRKYQIDSINVGYHIYWNGVFHLLCIFFSSVRYRITSISFNDYLSHICGTDYAKDSFLRFDRMYYSEVFQTEGMFRFPKTGIFKNFEGHRNLFYRNLRIIIDT
jgi:hypothetical protein